MSFKSMYNIFYGEEQNSRYPYIISKNNLRQQSYGMLFIN